MSMPEATTPMRGSSRGGSDDLAGEISDLQQRRIRQQSIARMNGQAGSNGPAHNDEALRCAAARNCRPAET